MTVAGYDFIKRKSATYPPTQRSSAGPTTYTPASYIVELNVNTFTGQVQVMSHHGQMDPGTMIVPELVSGQLQGGAAMGIGHALMEELPLYEDGRKPQTTCRPCQKHRRPRGWQSWAWCPWWLRSAMRSAMQWASAFITTLSRRKKSRKRCRKQPVLWFREKPCASSRRKLRRISKQEIWGKGQLDGW